MDRCNGVFDGQRQSARVEFRRRRHVARRPLQRRRAADLQQSRLNAFVGQRARLELALMERLCGGELGRDATETSISDIHGW